MPLSRIEVRRKWEPAQAQALIEAVHAAQQEALKIPAADRQIRLVPHSPEHFHVPPDKTENYTVIEISLFAGRSLDAKRALYQALVRKLGALGIAANDVFVVLNEIPLDNWGIRGGVPASEVDLGFQIDV